MVIAGQLATSVQGDAITGFLRNREESHVLREVTEVRSHPRPESEDLTARTPERTLDSNAMFPLVWRRRTGIWHHADKARAITEGRKAQVPKEGAPRVTFAPG